MTTHTRYFVIGAGLFLTVGLGTGLVAYYAGVLPHAASPQGLTELAYIPADSTVVAYADVHAIMNSEFRQKLRQALPSGSERDQFQAETGIDIERDVDYVFAAVHGGTPDSGGLALVHTSVASGTVETFLRQHGATASDYHGKHVLLMSESERPAKGGQAPVPAHSGTWCVAFVEAGVLAIGSETSVERAIDARAGENIVGNQEMMQYINDAQSQTQNAWVVGRFEGVSQKMNLPGAVSSQLSAVQMFSVVGHVDGGLSGRVRLDARDDASAENLRDIVRGGLALARIQMGHDSKIDGVINSLQMQGTGKTVELSFAVPSDVLDGLNGLAGIANLGRQLGPQKAPKIPKDMKK
jgi:hypothetical protein